MLKGKKTKYGVVITKPHSNEMYDHNERISDMMKQNILDAWMKEVVVLSTDYGLDEDWERIDYFSKIKKLQEAICYSGYGSGFSLGEVNDEVINQISQLPNYQLDEDYDDMVTNELVPELFDKEGRKIGLVGFN
tara:strand:+ start:38 stop:439 length:402 start_codon:yes stop_codon:yes gene_type:complete